ncbi:carbohydrate ABC transporter permease [Clostridium grantii]|uniref:Multiple sugar transport system permease protein n=1 Tax=Clostridium grantii DSM 8605 TaxID=1121316 RepID=A0A1M5T387_9CLOT|nr:carbohydrate ABC transporter permease [Clostridium grantii]SHH45080.1 multiple sugar transport system permease protein [Clostridium grantii DSM 8605]
MHTKSEKIEKILIYTLLCFLLFLSIIPFWLMFVNATRSTEQIQQGISLIPSKYLKFNWDVLTGRGFNIWSGLKNSAIIAFSSTFLSIYFSAMAAYGLVAYEFKGRDTLFTIILVVMMIPAQLSMVGFYRFMLDLNLVDSFIPIIFGAISSPATIFFLRQYLLSSFQKELIEAARIDGEGEIGIFHKIMLPIMKPALATMGIFGIVGSWNNYLMPLTLLTSESKYTLPMLVQLLKADIYSTEYGGIYLGLSLSVFPLLVTYLFLSKYIIRGITLGGVKE